MTSAGTPVNLRVSGACRGSTWHLSPQSPGCPLVGWPHLVQLRGRVPVGREGRRELAAGREGLRGLAAGRAVGRELVVGREGLGRQLATWRVGGKALVAGREGARELSAGREVDSGKERGNVSIVVSLCMLKPQLLQENTWN